MVSAVLLLSVVSGECGGNVVVGGQAVQREVGFKKGEERLAKPRKRHPLGRFRTCVTPNDHMPARLCVSLCI